MFVLVWLLFGLASAVIASQKGRSGCLWFILGMLFGPFGVLFAFLAGDRRPRTVTVIERPAPTALPRADPLAERWDPLAAEKICPDCAERIKLMARVCRFCGREFDDEEVLRERERAERGWARAEPEVYSWRGRLCPECGTRNGAERGRCRSCDARIAQVPVTGER